MSTYCVFLVDRYLDKSIYIRGKKKVIELDELLEVYGDNTKSSDPLFKLDSITSRFRDEESFKEDLFCKGLISRIDTHYDIVIGKKEENEALNGIIWSDLAPLLEPCNIIIRMIDMHSNSNLLSVLASNNYFCDRRLYIYIRIFNEAALHRSPELTTICIENALREYFKLIVYDDNNNIVYSNLHALIILISRVRYNSEDPVIKENKFKTRTLVKPKEKREEAENQMSFF